MQQILIVTEVQNYLILSLRDKFKEASYEVVIAKADIQALSALKDRFSAILVYADLKLAEQVQGLTYLKDRVLEDDIPIFVTGNPDELEEVSHSIPRNLIMFEFVRPVNLPDMVSAIDRFLKEHGTQTKKKILVVDDSGAMLRNVKGWLEDRYQVILANSGAMAIKYLALNRPDLVLLDYEMPVVDGEQVLEMIRSEMEFSDIPVIFLTSKGDKESVMKVMRLKPDGYLLKTMPPEQIIKTVDEFFMRQKLKMQQGE